jgi:hypothetical protein
MGKYLFVLNEDLKIIIPICRNFTLYRRRKGGIA